ncbi:tetratricopeptide repeat protein [Nonomuraea soli]|uniref:Tetratricopeptide (TPR) repeat protein n=1 Tax=Nonomuraea soli TaxID=1032476 RepID=A0A7W0CLM2_9ACTN|nr:tetratricopeptide repeat protein [Nonomuraea soli]MBA2893210.1 tetratricopeptide (TPR) repeat protein [Nonomuraea soli]
MRVLIAAGGVVLAGALIFTVATVAAPPQQSAATRTTETLQSRLQRLPGDYRGWARLATEHLEQARITGNPAFYPKAEQALIKANGLAPQDDAVLTAGAALAAARHDFSQAVRLAERAVAANPYSTTALGVLADARTQLGDHDRAGQAIERMIALRPGVASFSRASYAAELRGDLAGARRHLEYALADAYQPADVAYCRFYLGELALRSGELAQAQQWYGQALQAMPSFTPAIAGQARAHALSGDLKAALPLYESVVGRLPLPQYLVEYGEVRIKAGLAPDWTLLRAQQRLATESGVLDDLTLAEFEADHGDPALAVRHARAEFGRNPNPVAADALAWALHRAGRSREALPYAKQATATGWRNALLHHHRAEIEQALGLRGTSLARTYNPTFDPALPALARFS